MVMVVVVVASAPPPILCLLMAADTLDWRCETSAAEHNLVERPQREGRRTEQSATPASKRKTGDARGAMKQHPAKWRAVTKEAF
jgi:hypothetical protein